MPTGDQARGPLRAFNDYAAKPLSTWLKVVIVMAAVAGSLAVWEKRGAVVGVLAFLVYGGAFLMTAFNHRGTVAWSRRHVALDATLIVPLTFLALAYITTLSLWLCAVIGLAAGAVMVPVAVWRRGGTRTT